MTRALANRILSRWKSADVCFSASIINAELIATGDLESYE